MKTTDIKVNLTLLATLATELQAEGTAITATYKQYQTKTMNFVKNAVTTFVELKKAEDFATLRSSFSVITLEKDSVSASNVQVIQTIAEVMNLKDEARREILISKLLVIVSNKNLIIGDLNNFSKSFKAIENEKAIHEEYDYIASDENIVTTAIDKVESLLLPKVAIGGLYFTDEQLEEVKKDAKSKITFGRELKKFNTILQGVMKGFDKKEINDTDFKAYLIANLDSVLETYEEKANDTKKLSKSELEAKVKELEAKIAEGEKAPTKKIVA